VPCSVVSLDNRHITSDGEVAGPEAVLNVRAPQIRLLKVVPCSIVSLGNSHITSDGEVAGPEAVLSVRAPQIRLM
jgi:predicted ATP-dependent serine protease